MPEGGLAKEVVLKLRALIIVGVTALGSTVGAWGETVEVVEKLMNLPGVDPQNVADQEEMTWKDYTPIPGKNWADPALKPSEKSIRIALVAIDFEDQPFVITLPRRSDLFGNPQMEPVARETVPRFYADFLNMPGEINRGQTINGYWMEQSRGKYGVGKIDVFGPYRMPKKLWQYGLNELGQNRSTPDGSSANGRMEADCDALWNADPKRGNEKYDMILRIYAGYDETGIWQEFGEMKFETKEEIPMEWGNPDPTRPRWAPTRYVPWTSWKAGAQQWGQSTLRQGENSGTITHEIAHYLFQIGDNNNNPYVTPYRRAGSGPWDMMDRGSFNGPGGPHSRWVVPATQGASMPAGLMLRQKMLFGFLPAEQVLTLNRGGLAKSGLVVADVTARAAEPGKGAYAGIRVNLDGLGDKTQTDDPLINPSSAGVSNYTFYSMEVVQRIGYDSFCPDNGTLIAKNKDRESGNGGANGFNCFNWVIDANPQDIRKVDYYKPRSREAVMRTIADYRQLNDALFHAGTNSGSRCEFVDEANGLHIYVLEARKDEQGILSYRLGARSLEGKGPHRRGVSISAGGEGESYEFTLLNTGETLPVNANLHPGDAREGLDWDIYRVNVQTRGEGWSASLAHDLMAVKAGESAAIPVVISRLKEAEETATVIVTAVSESDPKARATSEIKLKR